MQRALIVLLPEGTEEEDAEMVLAELEEFDSLVGLLRIEHFTRPGAMRVIQEMGL